MKKIVFLLLAFACTLVSSQAPDNLRGVYKTLPIAGGTAGQAGATGYSHTGVTLASCSSYLSGGDYVLDGTSTPLVVSGCDFAGQVRISGNVTLKKSRVVNNSDCDSGCALIVILSGSGPVVIEDVEMTTTNVNAVGCVQGNNCRQDRTIGIFKDNTQPVTIRRVYAHHTLRGMDITGQQNITVVDSYMGPNTSPPIGEAPGSCINNSERAHSSAIRGAGGVQNVLIRNTVLEIGFCSWASGIYASYPEGGANHDVTISGGRWIIGDQNSGAYGIAVGCTNPESENYNFKVLNLQIQGDYSGTCPSGCGQSWNELAWTVSSASNAWTNVTKYPGGASIANDGTPAGGTPGTCP